MEKVFILVGNVPYETNDILGVYTSVKQAEIAMKEYAIESEYNDYETFIIVEHFINQPALGPAEEENDKERNYNIYNASLLIK